MDVGDDSPEAGSPLLKDLDYDPLSKYYSFAKVTDSKSQTQIRIHSEWHTDRVELVLSSDSRLMTAVYTASSAEPFIRSLDLNSATYMELLRSAFSDNSFVFSLQNDVLSVTKVITSELSVLHAKIKFTPANDPIALFDAQLDLCGKLLSQMTVIHERNAFFKRYAERSKAVLDQCVKSKLESEKILYAKFAEVINEKKRVIQSLLKD